MRTIVCILACAAVAAADELELRNGGIFSGIVKEVGDRVIVNMEYGSMSFKRVDVKRVDYSKPSVLQQYQERMARTNLENREDLEGLLAWTMSRKLEAASLDLRMKLLILRRKNLNYGNDRAVGELLSWSRANGFDGPADEIAKGALALKRLALKPGDAQASYELGLWARAAGIEVEALILFKQAITIDPDHEFARRALGYIRYQGRWMTDSEVKKAMGLIEFENQWVTPAGKEAIITARTLEKERRLLAEERQKLEAERADSREEYSRRRAEMDARSREIELRIRELRRRPIYVVPPPHCPPPQPPPCAQPSLKGPAPRPGVKFLPEKEQKH